MIQPRATSRFRSDDGQALVEFALVLPIMLMLLFGIVELGRAYNYWVDQTHLANQAARFATVDRSPSGGSIGAYVKAQGTTAELRNGSGQVGPALSICFSLPSGTSNVGDPVKVEAKSTFHWIPILGLGGLTTTNISGSATMRIEKAPTSGAWGTGCT